MADGTRMLLTWPNIYFSDIPIKLDFTILEHTEGQDYNIYVLTK